MRITSEQAEAINTAVIENRADYASVAERDGSSYYLILSRWEGNSLNTIAAFTLYEDGEVRR